MANPNIVNVTSIYGKTAGIAVTQATTAIVSNPAGSNKVFKVNVLSIANIDGTNAADVSVDVQFNASSPMTAVSRRLASTVSIPADSTLVVISKDSAIYLEEDSVLRVYGASGITGDLEAVCSYEEIA